MSWRPIEGVLLRYIEERAATIRLANRITGALSASHVFRIHRWTRGLVEVRETPNIRCAYFRVTADGLPRILMPRGLQWWHVADSLLHETCHLFLLHGAAHTVTPEPHEFASFRLLKDAEHRDETLADEMELALRLPIERVNAVEAELREQYGTPPSMGRAMRELSRQTGLRMRHVERRWTRAHGSSWHLDYLPEWSAGRTLELWHYPDARCWGITPAGQPRPTHLVKQEHRDVATIEFRLLTDLVALREGEFCLKYRNFWHRFGIPTGRAVRVPIDIADLLDWATRDAERGNGDEN